MEVIMHVWQLQEAKAHLSEVVRLCKKEGPQVLTVRGIDEVVMLSKKDYERFIGAKPSLYDFMRKSPLKGLEIICERAQSKNRDIEL